MHAKYITTSDKQVWQCNHCGCIILLLIIQFIMRPVHSAILNSAVERVTW